MSTKNCSTIQLLFFCAVALCCESDDDTTYPVSYYKSEILPTGRLRVFTHQGEITNQYVINRFIYRDTSTYNSWVSTLVIGGYLDTIRFASESQAFVSYYNSTIPCFARNTILTSVLTRSDTSRGFTVANELTHHVSYLISKEKPEVYSEYLYSSTRGFYIFGFIAREKFVLKHNGPHVSAPIIIFNWHVPDANTYLGGYVNNTLEGDFYRNLDEKDTVSLQEFQLVFEKESH